MNPVLEAPSIDFFALLPVAISLVTACLAGYLFPALRRAYADGRVMALARTPRPFPGSRFVPDPR